MWSFVTKPFPFRIAALSMISAVRSAHKTAALFILEDFLFQHDPEAVPLLLHENASSRK